MLELQNKEKDIKEIINALHNCNFDDLSDDGDELENKIVSLFAEKYHKPFDWSSGATKVVLIFKNFGFVIKIPLTYCNGYELCGAIDSEGGWNYCEQEVNRFQMVKKFGVEKMFLETKLLTDIDGYPIYIQELATILSKIENINNKIYFNHSNEDTKKIKEISSEYGYELIDEEWEADILVNYGEKFYCRFRNAIIDCEIEDLRSVNIGYVDRMPVIIDYAGFYD